MYGKELILDIHDCDETMFTKKNIQLFFDELCQLIDMEQVQVHWWEDHMSEEPHLRGVSAVQFIKTSNITIHTLEKLKTVFINIFSCKDFDASNAADFTAFYFSGNVKNHTTIERD